MLKTTVIGNIGGDAEIRPTKSGKNYVAFSVAHDKGREQPTTWVRVAWFGGVDHPLLRFLKKGAKLAVTGDLSVTAYMDRAGQPSVGMDLFADSVDVVLFPKREEGTAPAAQPQPRDPNHAPVGTAARRPAPAPQPEPAFGPGNPEYDRMPDFLKDEDMPA